MHSAGLQWTELLTVDLFGADHWMSPTPGLGPRHSASL